MILNQELLDAIDRMIKNRKVVKIEALKIKQADILHIQRLPDLLKRANQLNSEISAGTDVRIFDENCRIYKDKKPTTFTLNMSQEYGDRLLNVEHDTLNPLIFFNHRRLGGGG